MTELAQLDDVRLLEKQGSVSFYNITDMDTFNARVLRSG